MIPQKAEIVSAAGLALALMVLLVKRELASCRQVPCFGIPSLVVREEG
jgi:hypothetical protein